MACNIGSREYITDVIASRIECKAREDANSLRFNPPRIETSSYLSELESHMKVEIYVEQFIKRCKRNRRATNGM